MQYTVSPAEFASMRNVEIEPSEWFEITQDRVDTFADATRDHQFIHVDPERAAESVFGGTIAHGFLTLSLVTHLISGRMLRPEGTSVTVNYGSDKVRFLSPVRVGQRIRARQQMVEAVEKRPGQWLVRMNVTIDIEGEEKPALIAEILFLHII